MSNERNPLAGKDGLDHYLLGLSQQFDLKLRSMTTLEIFKTLSEKNRRSVLQAINIALELPENARESVPESQLEQDFLSKFSRLIPADHSAVGESAIWLASQQYVSQLRKDPPPHPVG